MEDKIKWAKLKQMLQSYLGESIDIICTTEFSDTTKSVFGFVGKENDGAFKIVININEIKSVEAVIDVLAHESAHIVTKSKFHNSKHKEEMKKIKKILMDGY